MRYFRPCRFPTKTPLANNDGVPKSTDYVSARPDEDTSLEATLEFYFRTHHYDNTESLRCVLFIVIQNLSSCSDNALKNPTYYPLERHGLYDAVAYRRAMLHNEHGSPVLDEYGDLSAMLAVFSPRALLSPQRLNRFQEGTLLTLASVFNKEHRSAPDAPTRQPKDVEVENQVS